MSWNQQDNKQYRGPIDRAFVSLTEPYEVDYFIDAYLATHHYLVNDKNRGIVRGLVAGIPCKAQATRVASPAFVNHQLPN